MALVNFSAWSSPIDWTKAEAIATRFAKSALSQPQSTQWQRVASKGTTPSDDNSLLYVFNQAEGHGFVIVAGDDAAEPILGYSTEGSFSFDNMPDNLLYWLELNELYVKACANRQVTARQASQGLPLSHLCLATSCGGRALLTIICAPPTTEAPTTMWAAWQLPPLR